MQREHQRYTHFLDVVLESSSGKIEARISEIGLGGCYVDTIVTVYEGDEVFFHLGPPFDESLRFAGTVVYVFPGMGFGIKFKDITDQNRAVIEQIIKSNGQ
jgi:PilZ domain-containing protein